MARPRQSMMEELAQVRGLLGQANSAGGAIDRVAEVTLETMRLVD